MTLWLTLLLVWTVGIPAAFFLTAFVVVRVNERRARRLSSSTILESVRVASVRAASAVRCGGRVHMSRPRAGREAALWPRAGFRRRV